MTFPDQSRYEGDFIDGLMEGQGLEVFTNGDKYSGAYDND